MAEILSLVLQIFIVAIIVVIGIAVLTVAAAAAIVFIAGTDTSLDYLDFDYED